MNGTPLAEEKGDELKKEILIALMDKLKLLKELNGEPFDEELMKDAKETKAARIQQAIEDKAAADAAAAEAAAEAKKLAEEGAEGKEDA